MSWLGEFMSKFSIIRFCSLVVLASCLTQSQPLLADSDTSKLNVLLICVDDLRPELNCYGVDYIHSPNIDALAKAGRLFRRHYVQAPTCGASRYTLLTGRYGGAGNGALFERAKRLKSKPGSIPESMPAFFKSHGYQTVSVGKVSHHPGGRGGKDWDDSANLEMPNSWHRHRLPAGAWQHPRGWMHGLANGEIRKNAKDMALFQATEGDDSIYPDGGSVAVALEEMDALCGDSERPFFLAVGILRPHLPFGAPKKYLDLYQDKDLPEIPHPEKPNWKTTWHGSGEFMKYQRWGRNPNTDAEFAIEVRKHYAACVSYADAQVGKLLGRLEENGALDNTVVVLWGDHGWHLGEHAIWGKHALFEESLHSPLIIRSPKMQLAGKSTDAVVETLDLFPTLAELTSLPKPKDIHGVSLKPILDNPEHVGHDAIAYRSNAQTIRTDQHRLVLHKNGEVELYDHHASEKESRNIAPSNRELVEALKAKLNQRLSLKK